MMPPQNEVWPAPEPRERALFGPARDDGALVGPARDARPRALRPGRRGRDPRELGTRPRVAQHCRLTTVGERIADWHWIDDDHTGERGPELEPWQCWPLGLGPVVLHV